MQRLGYKHQLKKIVSGIEIDTDNNVSDPANPKGHEISILNLRKSAITDKVSHSLLECLGILILVVSLDLKFCL